MDKNSHFEEVNKPGLHITLAQENLEYPVTFSKTNLRLLTLGYIRWHWHEEVELLYLAKGKIRCHLADDVFELAAPNALFINSNVLHSFHPLENDDVITYSVSFHVSFLFGRGQTYMDVKYVLPIIHANHIKYIVAKPKARTSSIIQEIIQLNEKKEFGYELLTKSLLCQLWYSLLAFFPHNSPVVENTATIVNEARVKKAISYIEEHYAEPITLENIADSIHISRSECCRCFKRSLNLTPFQYLMKYRIYESTRIMQTDFNKIFSISELAMKVGFNNTSYYNKLFKKYIHCTPKQYLQQLEHPANYV